MAGNYLPRSARNLIADLPDEGSVGDPMTMVTKGGGRTRFADTAGAIDPQALTVTP